MRLCLLRPVLLLTAVFLCTTPFSGCSTVTQGNRIEAGSPQLIVLGQTDERQLVAMFGKPLAEKETTNDVGNFRMMIFASREVHGFKGVTRSSVLQVELFNGVCNAWLYQDTNGLKDPSALATGFEQLEAFRDNQTVVAQRMGQPNGIALFPNTIQEFEGAEFDQTWVYTLQEAGKDSDGRPYVQFTRYLFGFDSSGRLSSKGKSSARINDSSQMLGN